MLNVARANKRIKKRIDGGEYEASDLSLLEMEALRKLYDEERIRKDSFEGKAKTTTMGLTIAMSIMMGGTSLFGKAQCRWACQTAYWITVTIIVLAALFLLIAGLYSIKCFSNENQYFFIKPDNITKKDADAKQDYDICIQKNREVNLIRNNLISGAYGCMRNALIMIFVAFALSVLPM